MQLALHQPIRGTSAQCANAVADAASGDGRRLEPLIGPFVSKAVAPRITKILHLALHARNMILDLPFDASADRVERFLARSSIRQSRDIGLLIRNVNST